MMKHSVGAVHSPIAEDTGRRRQRRFSSWLVGFVLALSLVGWSAPVGANEYEPKEAGHPLRIAAYVVHPIGVALDYLVMRPAYWVGSHEPFKTLFGRTD